MSATINCAKLGKIVDMEECKRCFYRRLDTDYSIIWCKYKRYQSRIQSLKEVRTTEIEELEKKKERLFKIGRTDDAMKVQFNISRIIKQNRIVEANNLTKVKLIDEAMAINIPTVTAIEEYLIEIYSKDELAQKIINPDKRLEECWAKVQEVAKSKVKGNVAELSKDEVFKIAREYFEVEI